MVTTNKLWIDSICINQEDTVEKTAQERCMAEIFATLRRVLIWLGEDVSRLPLMRLVAKRKSISDAQGMDSDENRFCEPRKQAHMAPRLDILQDFVKIIWHILVAPLDRSRDMFKSADLYCLRERLTRPPSAH
jgi:hypothetical protein